MKFTYAIYPDQRVIFQRYEGRFTTSDLITATRQMWADSAYRRDYNGIADTSDAHPSDWISTTSAPSLPSLRIAKRYPWAGRP